MVSSRNEALAGAEAGHTVMAKGLGFHSVGLRKPLKVL